MPDLTPRVVAGGLLRGPIVVLLSGGRDSVCLLDVAVRLAGPVTALHVNYGLRAEAGADEAHCAALCERLGVALVVHRPRGPEGNVQAWARAERYGAAERLEGLVATGHTASDQVETVLYRLAASPGRRALLGMPAREGRIVRPLLTSTREETAAHCAARGLPWREDPSNADPAYARNRVRHELLPALRAIHPAAEASVLRTLAVLRDEAAVLDALVMPEPDVARLAALPPALRRLTVQAMADAAVRDRASANDAGSDRAAANEAGGDRAPAVGSRADEILALAARGGTAALDLGGGLRAVVEYGRLRFATEPPPPAPHGPARLDVPGRTPYGAGELVCELGDGPLDADALATPLEIRPWRAGDRMRTPGGTRTLQDLFTDRKVPRERRPLVPVVVSGGEIAWVPGVATGERFSATAATRRRARLTWRSVSPS